MEIKNITIGEMAANEPKSIPIFKALSIDFCCGGKVNLLEALGEKGMSLESFVENVEKLKKESGQNKEISFLDMAPETLTEYIVDTHHEYLRNALPQTYALFLKVVRVHGANHPELYEAFKLFGLIKTDLEQHLIKEEEMLFPEASELNKAEVRKLVEQIKEEHEKVGGLFDQLRSVTLDYTLPSDACASYKNLYLSLNEIEEDIHEHIHLENNVLFREIK